MDNTLQYSKIISNAMQDYEKAITKEKDDMILKLLGEFFKESKNKEKIVKLAIVDRFKEVDGNSEQLKQEFQQMISIYVVNEHNKNALKNYPQKEFNYEEYLEIRRKLC